MDAASDPFADPLGLVAEERSFIADSTLNVGRNASLTLGTDALIVLDEGLREEPRFNCCGLLPSKSRTTRSIPFYNILWADLTKVDLTIHYAKPTSTSSSPSVSAAIVSYPLDLVTTAASTAAVSWVTRLLDRAYGPSQRRKAIKVLINPFGGAGKAAKLYATQIEPIFTAANCHVDVEQTQYRGHAADIVENLNINKYDVVAACSGDGVPMEIFNGLGRKENAAEALNKIAVVQLPCGSGNAMSWNLNGTGDCSMAALSIVKGIRMPLDLASVTQGEKRFLSFLSQSVGVVAESDLGTDNIRWMGSARFTFGFLVRLLGKTLYPCDIAVKTEIEDKRDIKRHYVEEIARRGRYSTYNPSHQTNRITSLPNTTSDSTPRGLPALKHGTILSPLPPPGPTSGWTALTPYANLGNFYAGNMTIMAESAPFFPGSLPSDGMMDLVTIDGDISRIQALSLLLSVEKNNFFDKDSVRVRKVSAYRIVPRFGKWAENKNGSNQNSNLNNSATDQSRNRDGGYISIDGESMPFEPFQVEVHRGLGTVLSRSGFMYEAPGPTGWEAAEGSKMREDSLGSGSSAAGDRPRTAGMEMEP